MFSFGRFIDGDFEDAGDVVEVVDPGDGLVAGRVRAASGDDLARAVESSADVFERFSKTATFERANMLERAAAILERRVDEVAEAIRREAGKPIFLAKLEATRAVSTLRMTAGAAREVTGQYRDMDGYSQGKGVTTLVRRFPIGPVAAISPFNFPLNLVMHKVAPALAMGCPVILKPARKTPLAPHLLAEILVEAGLEKGAYQIVVSPPEVAQELATDERLKLLTFTGSAEVGWHLKSISGRKKTVLELGGNAPVIVEEDADLKKAARQIAIGAFVYSGQVCISVQRILVHRNIYDTFKGMLVGATAKHATVGETSNPSVIVGPMISGGEADRVEAWVKEAVEEGASLLTKQERKGNTLWPVLLENVNPTAKVSIEEVFGPVAVLSPYDTLEQAVAMANDSEYGLQAGIFTSDVNKALYAYENMEAGGVVLNNVPTTRLDHMPYGGVKASGEGREGPLNAIDHMTEERVLVIQR